MVDTFKTLLDPINEPKFYIFSYISFPEDYHDSNLTFDFSSYKTLHNQLVNPNGTTVFNFIAIGKTIYDDPKINSILTKIEETNEITDREDLEQYLGDISQWNHLTNIKFIPFQFNPTNSIFFLKNILSNYLFNLLENKLKFSKENVFMFTFNNEELSDHKTKLLSTINKKFIEGNLKYNQESIRYELLNYIFDEEILDELCSLPLKNLLSELDSPKFDVFFEFRNKYVNCGYRIQDKNLNEIVSLPFPLFYLNQTPINLKNVKIDSYNTNKIIRDISDSNHFYFYIFNNVMTQIEDKKYNPDFSKRFFPLINEKNFKEILDSEISIEDKDYIESQRQSFEKFSTIEELVDNYIPSENLEELDIEYFEIKHNLYFPNNYELIKLFNDLKLSYEIPFVKFKDPLSKEMVYKLYKPITQIIGPNYIPILSKEELLDWIKYNSYNIEDNEVVPIKGNPKELSFKIKVIDIKDSKLTYEGTVKNFNPTSKSYDIEYENIIFPNITYFIEKKDKQDYKIGETIRFFKSIVVYADVNISIKGNIVFKIDISKIENIKALEIETIIEKFNHFLVYIFNLESMNSVNSFQSIITNLNLSIRSDLRSLKSTLGIKSDSKKPITYSSLYSLNNILFPFLLYDEVAFKVDEDIEYFNGKKWVGAKVKEFIGDKIKISVYDPKHGVIKEEEALVERKFLKTKESVENRKYVNFRYKRVSDFEGGNAIKNLIMKLNNLNIPKTIILERIIETFNITKELALKKLGDIIETEGKTLEKIKGNTGILIGIDWADPNENIYTVNLEGINSLGDYKYAIKIVRLIFDLNGFLYDEQENEYLEIYREFLEKLVEQTPSEKMLEDDKLSEIEQDANRGIEDDLFRETEGDVFDMFGDLGAEEPDIAPIEEEEPKNIEDKLRKDLNREYREEILLVEGKHSSNNIILETLYEVDPDLFDWKESSYSKACQRIKRYPKILSEKKKQEIDERDRKNNRPSSYATIKTIKDTPSTSEAEDCVIGKKLKLGKNGKLRCKALLWGSNEDNKYWYVCPRIWDTLEGKPLNLEDLDQEGEFLKFKSKNPDTIDWRTDLTTGKDITEFNPKYKGRTFFEETRQKIVPSPSKSILFMPKGENYSFPGFLNPSNHPKNLNVPCCFQDKSTRVKEVFDDLGGKIGQSDKNKYIQNWGKKLDANRIGLLPPNLRPFFEVNLSGGYTTGELQSTTRDWYRMGIQGGPDMFLSLIANIYTTVYREKLTAEDIKVLIVKNLTELEFNKLNRGNLNFWFLTNSVSSPFQNFLEYTLSNQEKDWELYYDLLTRPNPWLFPDGLNLVIFEYTTISTGEKINILCTDYLCENLTCKSSPTSVVLKKRIEEKENEGIETMEPIYYFKGSLKPLTFNPSQIATVDFPPIYSKILGVKKICRNLGEYKGYSIVNRNFSKFHRSINGYDFSKNLQLDAISKKYNDRIAKYVLSDFNKVIGIILTEPENLYLPVFPSPIPNELTLENSIYIEELSKTRSLLLTYDTALEHYQNMEKLYKLVPVIELYSNEKTEVTGFICQYGLVVPVKRGISKEGIGKVVNYVSVDKTIKEYRRKFIEANYVKPDKLEVSINIVEGFINEDYDNLTYSFSSYLVDQKDYVVGIIVNVREMDFETEEESEIADIIVPVERCYISDSETRKQLVGKKAIKINEFKIFNLGEYLVESGNIKRLSGYELQVLPLRGILDKDKVYRKIILESGLEIKLEEEEYFSVEASDDRGFKVNLIGENYVTNSLNKIDREYDDSFENESNRMIRNVIEIKYKQDILDSLRMQIAFYINLIENRELKFLIKEIIEDIGLNDGKKKVILLIIMRYLYSILVKDFKLSEKYLLPKIDTEIVLNNLTKKECRNYRWTSFSVPNVEIGEIKSEDSRVVEYYGKFREIISEIELKDDKCRLLVDDSLKENYIELLTEEIIRNRYRREQIINNKDIKAKGERFKWNKNTEILFKELELKTKFISELYRVYRQIFYEKYFPMDIEIDVPSVELDARPISYNIKYKVGTKVKDFKMEKLEEKEVNLNRVNFQKNRAKLREGMFINLGKKEALHIS